MTRFSISHAGAPSLKRTPSPSATSPHSPSCASQPAHAGQRLQRTDVLAPNAFGARGTRPSRERVLVYEQADIRVPDSEA